MIRPLKFELKPGLNVIALKGGSCGRPHFDFQRGVPCLWLTVDDARQHEKWEFYVALTGEALPDGYYYEPCGSALSSDGNSVLHLYRLDQK